MLIPFLAGVAGLALSVWGFKRRRRGWTAAGIALAFAPFIIVWIIAGSDRLFLRTVPLEQRLVSPNEAIRKRAEQDLLGLDSEQRRDLTRRLLPSLQQEGDPFVRKWAAIALALVGPQAQDAIPALLQCVSASQADVAQACRVALNELGTPTPEQLPPLLESLEDNRDAVRCEAAESIGRMGPAAEPALAPLLAPLRKEAPPPACFVRTLVRLSEYLPATLSELQKDLQDPQVFVRHHALEVLVEIGPRSPALIEALLDVLVREPDRPTRALAAKALTLRQLPEAGEIPAGLAALRRAKSPAVRQAALARLKRAAPPPAQVQSALVQALEDADADVRLAALEWLSEWDLQARPALGAILGRVRDPDVRVRRQAFEALRRLVVRRRDSLPVIARAQRDSDPWVRCMAAEQLVEMGAWDRVAVPLLIEDLRLPSEQSVCSAQALAQAGRFNPDVVPALTRLLHDPNRVVRSRACAVLMQLGVKAREAVPALLQAQKDQIPGAEAALHAIRPAQTHSKRR